MAASADVSAGDDILAADHNNLRADAIHATASHKHTGAANGGTKMDGSASLNASTVRGATANTGGSAREILAGSISSVDMRQGAARGSTSNTGTELEIKQGTIGTIDLRAFAVNSFDTNNGGDSADPGTAGKTVSVSKAATSKVLIIATARGTVATTLMAVAIRKNSTTIMTGSRNISWDGSTVTTYAWDESIDSGSQTYEVRTQVVTGSLVDTSIFCVEFKK